MTFQVSSIFHCLEPDVQSRPQLSLKSSLNWIFYVNNNWEMELIKRNLTDAVVDIFFMKKKFSNEESSRWIFSTKLEKRIQWTELTKILQNFNFIRKRKMNFFFYRFNCWTKWFKSERKRMFLLMRIRLVIVDGPDKFNYKSWDKIWSSLSRYCCANWMLKSTIIIKVRNWLSRNRIEIIEWNVVTVLRSIESMNSTSIAMQRTISVWNSLYDKCLILISIVHSVILIRIPSAKTWTIRKKTRFRHEHRVKF